jgi:serine/threonine-protein kinase
VIRGWVEGERLRDVLARGVSLSVVRVVALGERICDALAHAHKSGLLHLQLRASNVFLATGGAGEDARVVDFGLGSPRKALGRPVLGDVASMSPEQIEARIPSFKSDIFSAGLLLYRMIAGTPAWTGADDEVAKRVLSAPLPSLRAASGEALPPRSRVARAPDDRQEAGLAARGHGGGRRAPAEDRRRGLLGGDRRPRGRPGRRTPCGNEGGNGCGPGTRAPAGRGDGAAGAPAGRHPSTAAVPARDGGAATGARAGRDAVDRERGAARGGRRTGQRGRTRYDPSGRRRR